MKYFWESIRILYDPHIMMDLYRQAEFKFDLATDLTILQHNNAD